MKRFLRLPALLLVLISSLVVPVALTVAPVALTGCGTIYKASVTLSQAEDAVMKEWATLHNDRKTTPELDVKVMTAHATFNKAKLAAGVALRAYSAGGDKADYVKALEAARAAIGPLLDLIAPLLTQTKSQTLSARVANATAP